jgi:hypothetical protein
MPRRWRQFDTMQLSGAIKAEWDRSLNAKPFLIVVDVIGIGAGVVDRLTEQGLPVLGVNVAENPSTTNQHRRLRDELWDRTREWLASRAVRLPRDEELRDELVAPRYTYLVETKQSMRSRGFSSPDAADALIHTFASAGLGVVSGLTSGLFDKSPLHMSLADGDLV